ncbi:MAG: DNA recombination protein RmuC [Chloroflexi bacterium]|nr:DNA recombination protein RmuC [Chloroflexota bacterium]
MEDSWPILGLVLALGAILGMALTSIRHRSVQRQTGEMLSQMQNLLNDSLEKMPEQFQQISAKSLQEVNRDLQKHHEQAQQSQDKLYSQRQKTLDDLVSPIRETLDKLQVSQTQLGTRVDELKSATVGLEGRTGDLVAALRRPEVRGRWGELQLRRVVELAGMLNHVDFLEQPQERTSARRPDLIVHLPNERQIVVDAKTPLDAYLNAYEAQDDGSRQIEMKRHARQVKDNFQKLAAKGYWNSLEQRPDFVVMFIPGEVFYSAALQEMPDLIELSAQENVLIATPTILIALLRAVHLGWQERQLAERAREIGALGNELHNRARILLRHIGGIGAGLDSAIKSYNDAVGSLELRYLPQLREFKRLGATREEDLPNLKPLEKQTRPLAPQLDLPDPPDD